MQRGAARPTGPAVRRLVPQPKQRGAHRRLALLRRGSSSMDDDQVNLDEIAESKRRREAARVAGINESAAPAASRPQQGQPANEAAPKQWVKHVTKWLGAKSTMMQTRRVLTLRKKPAAL
jgi:hypothetical protein